MTKDLISNPANASWLVPEVNSQKVGEFVKENDACLVYVYTPTCKYCKQFSPIINQIYNKKLIPIVKINAFENHDYFMSLEDLTGFPHLAIYKNGVCLGGGSAQNPQAILPMIDYVKGLP